MAITIDWATKTINIPQSYLTLIGGTLYELDTNQLRLDLKALEASEYGMPNLVTNRHSTQVSVAGITYARVIEVISGYSITFEDGQYTVRLVGSNNNIFDVQNGILNQNQVQVIPTNSAGLQVVVSGSGVTQQDKDDIIQGVWDELKATHDTTGTFGYYVDAPISSIGGGSLTEESIADAVWNELKAGHDATGTFGYNLDVPVSSVESNITEESIVQKVWDEPKAGHDTTGTFGYNLDVAVSSVENNLTAESIADVVWNEPKIGHDTTGTFGYNLDVPVSSVESSLTEESLVDAIWNESKTGHDTTGTFGYYVDSKISDIQSGGGATPEEVATAVWDEPVVGHQSTGSFGEWVGNLHAEAFGKWVLNPVAKTLTLYKEDGITVLKVFNLTDTGVDVPAFVARTPV